MSSTGHGAANHYEVLGVPQAAALDEIRQAYRRLAREHHPDRHGGRTTPEMAKINEAWRVLSDSGRRGLYDASIARPMNTVSDSIRADVHPAPSAAPARFPWKFVVGFLALVTGLILLIGAFTDPGQTPPIDNIIRVGSCVDVDRSIQEAREVSCEGPYDAEVVGLVPFDGRCPVETETFRDRQGLGLVCVAG